MKWLIALAIILILNFAQVLIRHELNIYPNNHLVSFLIGGVIGFTVVTTLEMLETKKRRI